MATTPLKNYTTEVPADTSIQRIEQLLIRAKACNIMKEYDPSGNCRSISFILQVGDEKLPFRLPAKVVQVYAWLKRKSPRAKEETLQAQASRITWKQLHEWVHLQLSMIEIDQMEPMEAFFQYTLDVAAHETIYEKAKASKFKALLQ